MSAAKPVLALDQFFVERISWQIRTSYCSSLRAANAGSSGWRKILYFGVKTLKREIAKALYSTEDAHIRNMSIFET